MESPTEFEVTKCKESTDSPATIISDEARLMSSLVVLATTNPFRQLDSLPIIFVPPGYGLAFARAFNNGWTDNKDVGIRQLEGFDFPNETEYIKPARRAQLTGKDISDGTWLGYEPKFDRSKNGSSYWPNKDDYTWQIKWFMNDRDNGYTDNGGTANVDFLIWRL